MFHATIRCLSRFLGSPASLMSMVSGRRSFQTLAMVALLCGGDVIANGRCLAAQSQPARAMTLARALETARSNGPLHVGALALEQIGMGSVKEGTEWPNPSIEWRQEGVASGMKPDVFATAIIPFDLSGSRVAMRQSAGAGAMRVRGERIVQWRAADLEVARAYLEASAARMMLAVADSHAVALEEIAAIDEQRLREGLVSEAVGLRTSLEADRARFNAREARKNAAIAHNELARVLGMRPNELELADLATPQLPVPPDSAAAVMAASRLRPEIGARDAALREASRRLSSEQRSVLGEFELQAGTKQSNGVTGAQFGIAMPFPFFNQNDGARQRARGELMEAEVRSRDVHLSIAGAVGVAWAHYREIRDERERAATFSTRGADIGQIARTAYREGHITLTELLDTERASTEVLQLHIQWMRQAWLSRFEFEWALGARMDEGSALDLPLFAASASTPGSH